MSDLPRPWLAFYADDFTGATDAMERLELAGVATTLFFDAPTDTQLAGASRVEAIGVAGRSRSLPTATIEVEVRPALERLRELTPMHVHYKVCSTFDSSAEVGSIGRALDIGSDVFRSRCVPVLVGAPALGRWVVFANLFAGFGIGAETAAYRLDRHPAMRNHPVTPAGEADLRMVLAKQTDQEIGHMDARELDRPIDAVVARVKELADEERCDVLLFDTLTEDHLRKIGAALDALASNGQTLFSVGSSAVESALAARHAHESRAEPSQASAARGPALILVGSCSPVTARQVAAARRTGMNELRLDPTTLATGTQTAAARNALGSGESVLVTTGQADRDAAMPPLPADRLGEAFASVALACRDALGDGTLVIAGGDTSSHTVRRLEAESLTMLSPLTPGAPLCRLHAPGKAVDGVSVVLKGGQVGRDGLFASLAQLPEGASA